METPQRLNIRASVAIITLAVLILSRIAPQQEPELISPLPKSPLPPFTQPVEAKEKPDTRVKEVERFFEYYQSPLKNHASLFVEYADKYNLDYRIAPAITLLETSGGKNMKSGIQRG